MTVPTMSENESKMPEDQDQANQPEIQPEKKTAEDAEFENMMDNYLGKMKKYKLGQIVEAKIVAVRREYALLDFGEKAEGVVPIAEFYDEKGNISLSVGETIPVLLESREEETGQLVVSYKKAMAQVSWVEVIRAHNSGNPIKAKITKAVNKGVIAEISGIEAFLPASQIDIRPTKDLEETVGRELEVRILDCDQRRGKVVVSHRVLAQERSDKASAELFATLNVGDERVVVVKKIMDFGAFADMGGIDGLIPRSEISWDFNPKISDILTVGHDLKVKIIDIDQKKRKIALSRKQMRPDPWEGVAEKFEVGVIAKGKVVRVTQYEAFVAIEEGIQGRIGHEDLNWAKGRKVVSDILKDGDTVRCQVLEINNDRRRLALGLKQLEENPWDKVVEEFPKGIKITGKVTSVTTFGAFIQMTDAIDGMVHVSDITWEKHIKHPKEVLKVGEEVEAIVIEVDAKNQRVKLGIKQLESSPFELYTRQHRKGSAVEGEVKKVMDFAVIVQLAPNIEGRIHVSQISEERVEKPSDAIKVGEKVTALVKDVDNKRQRIELSLRDFLKKQEREEIKAYSQTDVPGGQTFKELFKNIQLDQPEE